MLSVKYIRKKKGRQGEGGGQPPIVFSDEQVIELKALAAVLTKGQIADYFGISENDVKSY